MTNISAGGEPMTSSGITRPTESKLDKGPSIYDVHKERGGVRLRWTHVDGGGGSSPMWTSTHKIKIRVH